MDLTILLEKLQREKGLVLKDYKESTIRRRIKRRMKFDKANSLDEYIQMIDRDYHLYWRLVSDFFIGVTDFFRDPEIWEVVKEKVLPELVMSHESCDMRNNKNAQRMTHDALRIWSAGCSSGEETYSLAMLLNDYIEKNEIRDTRYEIRVFGTDIMEDKLEIARKGEYEAEKVEKIEDRLREKYLVMGHASCDMRNEDKESPLPSGERVRVRGKIENACRMSHVAIRSDVRSLTHFRKYDLTKPEPLAGFDMIVCRNVLIYFQDQLQKRVIKHFYNALKPGGVLWLGKSETLWGETKKLFEPIFKRERIFRKL